VCDTVRKSKKVVAYGIVNPRKGVEKRDLIVDHTFMSKIYLIGRLECGFSGGPVVDEDRKCVIGLVSSGPQIEDKYIKAANLTDDDWR
jgi:hypothetical protein